MPCELVNRRLPSEARSRRTKTRRRCRGRSRPTVKATMATSAVRMASPSLVLLLLFIGMGLLAICAGIDVEARPLSSGKMRAAADARKTSDSQQQGQGQGQGQGQRHVDGHGREGKDGLPRRQTKREMETEPADFLPELIFADSRDFSSFPSVNDSSIMFLHVFKCAGTSLREVFMSLADAAGWTGAIVEGCKPAHHKNRRLGVLPPKRHLHGHRICINHQHDLIDVEAEKGVVAQTKVLAGHFFWDFTRYAKPPHLMITTLRNPLELYVSSMQFMHRDMTDTLPRATAFVDRSMRTHLMASDPNEIGYIRRFLDAEEAIGFETGVEYTQQQTRAAVARAVDHLNTFWVVGVVEQYAGFMEVLKVALDPNDVYPNVWEHGVEVRNNGSPVHSLDVLYNMDPDLVRKFNSTALGYEWEVYEVALQLWDTRCRELLPATDHDRFCTVQQRC